MENKLTTELLKSLLVFQSNCDPIPMNQTVNVKMKSGGTYSFKYADLGQIHLMVKPLLSDQGLGFFQVFQGRNLVTVVYHAESSGLLVSNLDLNESLSGKGTQDAGGVITYFKRYALAALLGIISDEDDDANAANVKKGDEVQKETKPWLNPGSPAWAEAVKFLAGNGTLDAILKKYAISRANREKLLSESV